MSSRYNEFGSNLAATRIEMVGRAHDQSHKDYSVVSGRRMGKMLGTVQGLI